MIDVTIKAKPHSYPNFIVLDIPNLPGQSDVKASIDVGQAFPSDALASQYWDDLRAGWILHVQARRGKLGKSEQP